MKKDSLLRDKNLYILFSISMMQLLSVASIAPAFPRMMQSLGLTTTQIGLIVTSFSLPSAILAPIFGIMADRFGRKKILVPGLFVFGIFGFACGLTDNFVLILVLRGIQGIGASVFVTIGITLIADIYRGPKIAEAMGYNSVVISMGVAIYPLIGGALATMDWHYPFLLPILAVPVGFAVLFLLDNPEPKRSQPMNDYLGSIWKSLKDVSLLGFFGTGIVSFIILYGAFITYFPLLMAQRFGASPFFIGLITSIGSLAMAISSSQVGRLFRQFSAGAMLKIAFIGFMIGGVLVPFMPSLPFILIPGVLVNLAMGIVIPCIHTSVSQKAPTEYRAAVMSLNSTAIRVGQTLGPPFMALPYGIGSFNSVYFSAAVLALIMLTVAVLAGRVMRRGEFRSSNTD